MSHKFSNFRIVSEEENYISISALQIEGNVYINFSIPKNNAGKREINQKYSHEFSNFVSEEDLTEGVSVIFHGNTENLWVDENLEKEGVFQQFETDFRSWDGFDELMAELRQENEPISDTSTNLEGSF